MRHVPHGARLIPEKDYRLYAPIIRIEVQPAEGYSHDTASFLIEVTARGNRRAYQQILPLDSFRCYFDQILDSAVRRLKQEIMKDAPATPEPVEDNGDRFRTDPRRYA
jgi:hypothetical protein